MALARGLFEKPPEQIAKVREPLSAGSGKIAA
jgi:hypothetical protein